jgi:hypothetical protein
MIEHQHPAAALAAVNAAIMPAAPAPSTIASNVSVFIAGAYGKGGTIKHARRVYAFPKLRETTLARGKLTGAPVPSTHAHIHAIGTAVPDHDIHAAFVEWAAARLSDRREAALFRRMDQRRGSRIAGR